MSCPFKGYWVTSFHLFDRDGLRKPFEAQIEGETGDYWMLKAPNGERVKAHKGACSIEPYKLNERDTKAYRKQVEQRTGHSLQPADNPPPKREELPNDTARGRKQRKSKTSSRTSTSVSSTKANNQKRTSSKSNRSGSKDPFGGLLDF